MKTHSHEHRIAQTTERRPRKGGIDSKTSRRQMGSKITHVDKVGERSGHAPRPRPDRHQPAARLDPDPAIVGKKDCWARVWKKLPAGQKAEVIRRSEKHSTTIREELVIIA